MFTKLQMHQNHRTIKFQSGWQYFTQFAWLLLTVTFPHWSEGDACWCQFSVLNSELCRRWNIIWIYNTDKSEYVCLEFVSVRQLVLWYFPFCLPSLFDNKGRIFASFKIRNCSLCKHGCHGDLNITWWYWNTIKTIIWTSQIIAPVCNILVNWIIN